MGYYMDQRGSEFKVKAKNVEALREALADHTACQRHISWVSKSVVLDAYYADDIRGMFQEWRWEITIDDDGNITAIEFIGEKLGDDADMFEAIGPHVEAGSYIEMSGEDSDRWRWVFTGTAVETVQGRVVWEDQDA